VNRRHRGAFRAVVETHTRTPIVGPLALVAVALVVSALCLDGGPLDPVRPPLLVDAIEYEHRSPSAFDGHGRVTFGVEYWREPVGAGATVVAWNERVAIERVGPDEVAAAHSDRGDLRVTETDAQGHFSFEDLEPNQRWSSLVLWSSAATAALEPRPIVPDVTCEHVLMGVVVQATRFQNHGGEPLGIDRLVGRDGGLGQETARASCGTGMPRPGIDLERSPERDFVLAYHGLRELVDLPVTEGLLFVRQSWAPARSEEGWLENLTPLFRRPNSEESDPASDSDSASAEWRRLDRARVDGELLQTVTVEPLGFDGRLRLRVPRELTSKVALQHDLTLRFTSAKEEDERRARFGKPSFVLDLANLALEEEIADRVLEVDGLPLGTWDVVPAERHSRSFARMPDGSPWLLVGPPRVSTGSTASSGTIQTLRLAFLSAPATIHLELPASIAACPDRIHTALHDHENEERQRIEFGHADHTLHGVLPGRWTVFVDRWGREYAPIVDTRRVWIDVEEQRDVAAVVLAAAEDEMSVEDAVRALRENTLLGHRDGFLEAFTIEAPPGADLTFRVACER